MDQVLDSSWYSLGSFSEKMDQETVTFDLNELPKSDWFPCSVIKDKENLLPCKHDDLPLDPNSRDIDLITAEKSLAQCVWNDDSACLVSLSHEIRKKASEKANLKGNVDSSLRESVYQSIASRLLHLACKLDSVDCAAALLKGECTLTAKITELDENGRTPLHNAAKEHSIRCIELLLQKAARTDIRSKDDDSLIPLEGALSSKRLQVDWTPNETVERLLYLLSERDLSAVRLLMVKTRELPKVVYNAAMEGRVAALAVLLMVDADRVNALMVLPRDIVVGSRVETTVYECVIKEAIALGRIEVGRMGLNSCEAYPDSSENRSEKRKAMLCAMELLQLFGAVSRGSCTDRKMALPLISACEAGDEAVVELLLKTKIDVSETDGDGNSALHWCLRPSPYSKDSRFRLVRVLLRHGARVSQKNKLGLTPVHVAAGSGNFQALQILLVCDPNCVNIASETEETPLFFAVKSNLMECVELLLSYGANTQSLNLRKERPIDLTKSQDMRFILSPTNLSFWNHVAPIQEAGSPSLTHDNSDADTYELLNVKNIPFDRICTSAKSELCRYYGSPTGCTRGAKCFFAHGDAELKRTKSGSAEFKLGLPSQPISRNLSKHATRVSEDLSKKIFIGGLPPSVDSGDLRDYFEKEFGAVEDAVVIGSQAANHVQSRGFGFVTFKSEDSVAAAVQAHYVNISGKKVEIKGAIPKVVLLHEFQKLSHQQKHEHQQLVSPIAMEAKDKGRQETASWVETLFGSGLKTTNPDIATQKTPQWLKTFKRWLPSFLIDASKRLGEGECYPLSSLKGDFRATCGMELDHTSLGFLKLSDFMRSFSGVCRMKIVPVGKGPATHMVLLPSLPQSYNQPHSQTQTLLEEPKPQPFYDDVSSPYQPSRSPLSLKFNGFPWGWYDVNDENEVGFFARLLSKSFSNVECAGLDNSGGSGGQQDLDASLSSSVDPRFLSFLQPGYSFLRPWETTFEQTGGLEGREAQKASADNIRAPFSYFAHQFDDPFSCFFPAFERKNLCEKNICAVCKERKAQWGVMPCKHKLVCVNCTGTAPKTSVTKCFHCHLPVEGFFKAAWEDVTLNSPTCDNESILNFPPLSRQDSSQVQKSRRARVPAIETEKSSTSPDDEGSSSTGVGGASSS